MGTERVSALAMLACLHTRSYSQKHTSPACNNMTATKQLEQTLLLLAAQHSKLQAQKETQEAYP
jgi:hypothetical protein